MNYQRIVIAGNATNDVELKEAKSGVQYLRFSVAVNEGREGKPTFFPIVAFGKTAELAAKLVSKGRVVLIEGRVSISNEGKFNIVADYLSVGPNRANQSDGMTAELN